MPPPDRPSFIRHWTDVEGPDDNHYDNDDELMRSAPRSAGASA